MSMNGPESDAQKAKNLRAFFDGEAPRRAQKDLSNGVSDEDFSKRKIAEGEEALAELDRFMVSDEAPSTTAAATTTTVALCPEADDLTYERIEEPLVVTPYDSARQRVVDAEILRDVAEPGSDNFHTAMRDLAEAKRAFREEEKRATDEGWRERRAIDEWRSGVGREDYNTSRRKVRDRPNNMTPKVILSAMTTEERAQHDRDKNAERQRTFKLRKKGLSEAEIEVEMSRWWARRRRGRS